MLNITLVHNYDFQAIVWYDKPDAALLVSQII